MDRFNATSADNETFDLTRMVINKDGNVGIGTDSIATTTDGRLKISAPSGISNSGGISLYGNNSNTFGGSNVVRSKIESLTDGTAFGANMIFSTNDTSNVYQERMRITSGGNINIGGNINLSGILYTDDDELTLMSGGDSGGTSIIINDYENNATLNGDFLASGEITAYSDKRLKEVVNKTPDVLNDLMKVNIVDYKRTDKDDDKVRTGVIAQELREVFPQYVKGDEDKEMLSVNYAEMVSVCIKAIQELEEKVKKLENK